MHSNWGIVVFLWAGIIIGLIVLLAHELSKSPEQKARDTQLTQQRYEGARQARKIVEVIPMGVSGTQFKRGGLGGALLGGFIGGVPGAIVGGMLRSGKGVPVESFAVKYGDGHVVIRQCVQGSSEHKTLMGYVK